MRRTLSPLVLALVLFLAAPATHAASPAPAAGHGDAHASAAAHADRQPVLAESSKWPGVMLIVIGGMFLAAAVIGPVVRAEMAHSEPPGHGHGHDDHDHAGHGAHGGHGTSDHGHH